MKDNVRRLMHNFMDYPAVIRTASLQQIRDFTVGRLDSIGPVLDPLILDLVTSVNSSWNLRAATLFLERFLSTNAYPETTEKAVEQ